MGISERKDARTNMMLQPVDAPNVTREDKTLIQS